MVVVVVRVLHVVQGKEVVGAWVLEIKSFVVVLGDMYIREKYG